MHKDQPQNVDNDENLSESYKLKDDNYTQLSSNIANLLNDTQLFDKNKSDTYNFQMIDDKPKRFKCIDRYLVIQTLGEGSYSKVKEVFDTQYLVRRAIKLVKCSHLKKIPDGETTVETEMIILRSLNHPNIIKLYDVMCDQAKETIYFVLEFCITDIMKMLRGSSNQCNNKISKKFPLWQAHHYFKQLINGIEYLHSLSIIHKDIKPANLLITLNHILKICDFGVSEKVDIFSSNLYLNESKGTPIFQSPEVNLCLRPFAGEKLDIWGCGICLYFMVTGMYPFGESNIFKIIDAVCECKYEIPLLENDIDGHVEYLIRNILKKDSSCRLSLQQIKNSQWLTSIPSKDEDEIHFPLDSSNDPKFNISLSNKLDLVIREYTNSISSYHSYMGSIRSTRIRRSSSYRHSVISQISNQLSNTKTTPKSSPKSRYSE